MMTGIALLVIHSASPFASCEEVKPALGAKGDPFVAYVASNRAQLAEFIVGEYARGYIRGGTKADNENEVKSLKAWGMGLGEGLACDRLVSRVADVAKYNMQGESIQTGAWITNRIVISFLVAALRSEDRYIPERAKNELINVFPPALSEHEAEMIDLGANAPLRILARINRNPSTALKSLVEKRCPNMASLPREILARIGDQAAEQALIADFTRENDARAKGELAVKLGYVASSNTLIAIAKEFRSPLIVNPEDRTHTIGREYSIRYKILLGLREAFPAEALFSDELAEVVKQTERCFMDRVTAEKTKRCAAVSNSYYDKVEEWLTVQFGIRWEMARPDDFVLKRAGFRFTPEQR